MKLATLPDGTPDGRLVAVSKDLTQCASAPSAARSLAVALDDWRTAAPALRRLYAELCEGRCRTAEPFDPSRALAPLPRARQWLDGSAFASHGRLMMRAFNLTEDPGADGLPLMYQGLADHFLAPCEDVPLPSEADGIDFEGEFAVVVDDTPMGVSEADAASRILLVLQVNDWSLRALGPREMKTGFGFVQAKPACSMAPVAVTPDELGEAWRDGQVALPLDVRLNDEPFGRPIGDQMAFPFPRLIAHAARTRRLSAGTIIGSGTVSNDEAADVGSACIAERRALEIIAHGRPVTDFMQFGDRVRMECRHADGAPLFGPIDQRVVPIRQA